MNQPVILAIIGGVLAAIPAVLVYRRSKQHDEAIARAGVVSDSAQAITQAMGAMQTVIATLQAEAVVNDNQLDRCRVLSQELQRELNRMYRKFGDNGGAHAPTPV